MRRKLLILAPYPQDEAPSQRFRFEQFLKYFPERNLEYKFYPFWSAKAWKILYSKGNLPLKLFFLLEGFLGRLRMLFIVGKFDWVLIHRELTPIGPPVFEFLISRVFSKRIIYDFDDAIWLPNTSVANKMISGLKFYGKVKNICSWSWKVTVGNEFLARYAATYNSTVCILPTLVDTDHRHNKIKNHRDTQKPVIGWTGTHSTSVYLRMLEEPLKNLREEMDFDFLVISDQSPEVKINNFIFVPWKKEEEIEQLIKMDIGVMPLNDSPWEKGKCGFKLIQYLSLGIPAVASPVGVNAHIIAHSKNGYIAKNAEDWKHYLKLLLKEHIMRTEMGMRGRKTIQDQFSVAANLERFFSLFE